MSKPEPKDLITYLTETLDALKKIKNIVAQRNKTVRIKAITSMLIIIEARMDAGLKYARAGGESGLSVALQQQMYDPIIQWLGEEITK
jgi:hypothetical protein